MAAERFPPPEDLEQPGKDLWRLTQAWLQAHDFWVPTDAPALERYVRAVELGRRAREAMAGEMTAEGSMGQPVAHPLAKVAREADRDAHDYAKDLLLTPAVRRRHEIESSAEASDSLEDWLTETDEGNHDG